jgi:hypothetical protein
LPENSYCNFAGFLIRDLHRIIEIDEEVVEAETARLRATMLIGYFVGGRPAAAEIDNWLVSLNSAIETGNVKFSHYEGT